MGNNTKLKKELTLLGVFSITSGTMISAGLFILPGLAYAKAGPAVILSYLIAGLLTIPGLLSQAELSTAMPKAGGSYYFITRSMGPAVGTIYGIITWFALAAISVRLSDLSIRGPEKTTLSTPPAVAAMYRMPTMTAVFLYVSMISSLFLYVYLTSGEL